LSVAFHVNLTHGPTLATKTVEFHLGRIYRKLDINSRAELIRRYASEQAGAVSSAL
jgi:hypothetical protein